MTTTFTQTGGVRISVFNATWPFATIEVADSELRIRCFWKCWTFPKNQITRLSEHRSLSTGLRIQHNVKSYAEFVVFWTFGFGKLKRALEERGYTVYDQDRLTTRHQRTAARRTNSRAHLMLMCRGEYKMR